MPRTFPLGVRTTGPSALKSVAGEKASNAAETAAPLRNILRDNIFHDLL